MNIEIYEGEKLLFTDDCGKLREKLAEGNDFVKSDIDKMYEYYRNGSTVKADVLDIITADKLDAEYSKNVFWLMKIITDYGIMEKISPQSRINIIKNVIPVISAVTKSHELAIKRKRSVINFVNTISEENRRVIEGKNTVDGAMEKIVSALPSKSAGRKEYESRPEFLNILRHTEEMSKTCADPEYTRIINEYISEITE